MKCIACQNTDKDVSFFICINKNTNDHVCGMCVDKMYSHYLNYTIGSKTDTKDKFENAAKSEADTFKIPSANEIVQHLNRYIIGQEDAKKTMAIAVRNHYKRLQMSEEERALVEKSNILIMGESGTGKTAIAKAISQFINVPMVVVDSASMSGVGYCGDDVDVAVTQLYERSGRNKEATERGIIFLDEIDKKKKSRESRTADVSGEDVQKGMLRLLEGKEIKVAKDVRIDTSNILFILGGAFVGLDKIVEERLEKNAIGFGRRTQDDQVNMGEIYSKVTTEDLVKFGMIPELIGRVPVHTYTNSLSKDDIKKVMVEPENSIVKQMQRLFAVDNVRLTFKEDAIDYVAEKVIKDKIGVRGLRKVLEQELKQVQFEVEEYAKRNIRSVVVTKHNKHDGLKTTFRYGKKVKANK